MKGFFSLFFRRLLKRHFLIVTLSACSLAFASSQINVIVISKFFVYLFYLLFIKIVPFGTFFTWDLLFHIYKIIRVYT